jgi:hypothetical protein
MPASFSESPSTHIRNVAALPSAFGVIHLVGFRVHSLLIVQAAKALAIQGSHLKSFQYPQDIRLFFA